MFALEDELQGKTIDDAYAKQVITVQVWVAGRWGHSQCHSMVLKLLRWRFSYV